MYIESLRFVFVGQGNYPRAEMFDLLGRTGINVIQLVILLTAEWYAITSTVTCYHMYSTPQTTQTRIVK